MAHIIRDTNSTFASTVSALILGGIAGINLWVDVPTEVKVADQPTVPTKAVVEVAAAPDLAAMLADSRSAAEGRNQAALTLCTSEIVAVLDRQFGALHHSAESTAAGIATYGNCLKIIGMLASDKVRGRSDAHEWIRRRVEDGVAPRIGECQREVQAVLDRFDRDMAASTLAMAVELAAIGSSGSLTVVPEYAAGLEGLSLTEALEELGFGGLLVTPPLILDVYALLHSKIAQWMITKVVEMAKWIFARPLAAAAAEAGLVVADGPLPIGDIIAAVGAVWTAYDIYALRNHFEMELLQAVRSSLPDARRDIQQKIWSALRERVASHAEIQTRMHDEAKGQLGP